MTTLTENFHNEGFLVSEDNGTRSRGQGTISGGVKVLAGTVLGIVADGSASSAAFAGNTGNGVMGAVTLSAGALPGAYKLVIIEKATNAGAFEVTDPSGKLVGTGNVAAAFSAGGLAFTLADGATDFVAGDGFTITVAAGSGKYKPLNLSAADGTQNAVAILLSDADASSADVPGALLVRSAEVNASELVWPAGINGGQITAALAQLAAFGIIAR